MPYPTMQDIADALGVSKMTVSRSLRGVGRVKASTREQVREMARKMGYLGSPDLVFGQPIHRGTSDHSLRVLWPLLSPAERRLDGNIALSILRGVRDRLAINEGAMLTEPCDSVEEILAAWRDRRASGVMLREQLPARWVARLQEAGPVVYASSHDFYWDVDAVYTNELRSAARVQTYLHRRGCERLAWFGLLDRNEDTRLPQALFAEMSGRERAQFAVHGPRYAAWTYLAHGTPTARVLLPERDWQTQGFDEMIAQGVDDLLADVPPEAIVTPNYGMAAAVIGELEARGIRVPEDVSVVGYDSETRHVDSRALTTVLLPMYDIGRAVPDLIERRLAAPAALPMTLLFQTSLVDGDTVRAASQQT